MYVRNRVIIKTPSNVEDKWWGIVMGGRGRRRGRGGGGGGLTTVGTNGGVTLRSNSSSQSMLCKARGATEEQLRSS